MTSINRPEHCKLSLELLKFSHLQINKKDFKICQGLLKSAFNIFSIESTIIENIEKCAGLANQIFQEIEGRVASQNLKFFLKQFYSDLTNLTQASKTSTDPKKIPDRVPLEYNISIKIRILMGIVNQKTKSIAEQDTKLGAEQDKKEACCDEKTTKREENIRILKCEDLTNEEAETFATANPANYIIYFNEQKYYLVHYGRISNACLKYEITPLEEGFGVKDISLNRTFHFKLKTKRQLLAILKISNKTQLEFTKEGDKIVPKK